MTSGKTTVAKDPCRACKCSPRRLGPPSTALWATTQAFRLPLEWRGASWMVPDDLSDDLPDDLSDDLPDNIPDDLLHQVVVKGPSDFLGSAVGESERKTVELLEACRGKVRLIDAPSRPSACMCSLRREWAERMQVLTTAPSPPHRCCSSTSATASIRSDHPTPSARMSSILLCRRCPDHHLMAICLPSACHLLAICLPSACHLMAI